VAIAARTHLPTRNLLLDKVKPAIRNLLYPELVPTQLRLGATLYEEHESQRLVYFPTSGVVSLVFMMENGQSAEMAIVGSEGLVGFAALLGGDSTTTRAVVQVAGEAFCIRANTLATLVDNHKALRQLTMCYIQSLLAQFAQTAICNRHHSIEQQWCRWILMSMDRSGGEPIRMTQQLVAEMLGVRREGVSAVASSLKTEGVVEYSRGIISLLDRKRLEMRVCECYSIILRETERLLPGSNKRR
jgi:CRP-like cAMP-binding protein